MFAMRFGMARALFFLACVLVLSAPALAVVSEQSLRIFAISDGGGAITAQLTLKLVPGTGKVWTSVEPLVGTATQESAKEALRAAAKFSNKTLQYDYFFDINSTASTVDGPSAGSAMGLLLVSSLENKPLPLGVGLTGTLSEDGQIGEVGGVFEKSKEAARVGMKLFMIPKGEARQIVRLPNGVQPINLIEYGPREWGLKIVEIDSLSQAEKLAFTPIDEIVPAEVSPLEPLFVPSGLPLRPQLEPMKEFTERFIKNAEVEASRARDDLGKSSVSDPALVDAMLIALNATDRLLAESKPQLDRNFLFTAANNAFLAQVNTLLVRDLVRTPGLAEWNNVVFRQKLEILELEIGKQKSQLINPVPRDSFEWWVGAQQRLSWAEEKLHSIRNRMDATPAGSVADQIGLLTDFEYAQAWLSASKDFAQLAIDKNPGKSGFVPGEKAGALADEFILRARTQLDEVPDDQRDGVEEKLDAAVIARESQFPLAAAYNAAFALALSEAAQKRELLDVNQMADEVVALSRTTGETVRKSDPPLVWPALYFDHAAFYRLTAENQFDKGQVVAAQSTYQSALILLYLSAYQAEIATRSAIDAAELPPTKVVPIVSPIAPTSSSNAYADLWFYIAGGLFVLCLALLVYAMWMLTHRRGENVERFPIERKIDQYSKLQSELSKSLANNQIGKIEYMDLYTQYEAKKQALIVEKNRVSKLILLMESVSQQSKSMEAHWRALRREYKMGAISTDDFEAGVRAAIDQASERMGELVQPAQRSIEAPEGSSEGQLAPVVEPEPLASAEKAAKTNKSNVKAKDSATKPPSGRKTVRR